MTIMDSTPQGELVLRTLAMPADTNANGDIFGGWLMSQMDIGGAILAKEIAHRSRCNRTRGRNDVSASRCSRRCRMLLCALR
ncbi:acyl-coA hydrolase [Salmonella bongori]|nr:acyl-coA hydrolase [Salmonella bongori]